MHLTFSQKLGSIVGILAFVAIIIAWIGLSGASQLNESLKKIVDVDSEKVKLAAQMQQNIIEMHRAEKNMILSITQTDMDTYRKNFNDAVKILEDRRTRLRSLVDDTNKNYLDNFKKAYEEYVDVFKQIAQLTRKNSNEKAKVLMRTDARDKVIVIDKNTDELRINIQKEMNTILEQSNISSEVMKVIEQKLQALELISNVESNLLKSVRDAGRAILLLHDEEIKAMSERSNEFLDATFNDLKSLKQVTDDNKNNMIDKTLNALEVFDKVQTKVLELTQENSNQKAAELSATRARELVEKARSNVFEIAKINDENMNQAKITAAINYENIRNINITVAIVGILVAILIAYFMVRQMMAMVTGAVTNVNEGAEQVASASNQIASSSQQLAEGAQEQAASVEEVTSSLAQTKATVDQNAENAREADMLSKDANDSAKMGYEHIRELTDAMEEINESSRKIANIIKTIDEIAFQTNLLALNAAVEAARAGEHGLGFAVVAEEVRNLAQRSAEAAKDTANIIEQSIAQVNKGNEITTSTNKAFEDILEKVKKTGDITGEIAMASTEQAQGVNQITEAMEQVDAVTQTMASNSEESAAASEEMNAQAVNMKQSIGEVANIFGIKVDQVVSTGVSGSVLTHHVHMNKKQTKSTMAHKSASAAKKPSEVMPLDEDDMKEF